MEDRRKRARALAREAADAPPTDAELDAALARLPVIAERLRDLPQPELRGLFERMMSGTATR